MLLTYLEHCGRGEGVRAAGVGMLSVPSAESKVSFSFYVWTIIRLFFPRPRQHTLLDSVKAAHSLSHCIALIHSVVFSCGREECPSLSFVPSLSPILHSLFSFSVSLSTHSFPLSLFTFPLSLFTFLSSSPHISLFFSHLCLGKSLSPLFLSLSPLFKVPKSTEERRRRQTG